MGSWRRLTVAALVVSTAPTLGCERGSSEPTVLVEPAPLPTVSPLPPADPRPGATAVPQGKDASAARAANDDASLDDRALASILAESDALKTFAATPERYRLQVLVGTLASADGPPVIRQAGYRVDADYIYPASAIKTLLSVAALAAAEERGGDVDTPLGICEPDCRPIPDPTNRGVGRLTLGHAIRKIQLVSDNDAFGQLFDFVGRAELNRGLWELGLSSARLHHRMGRRPDDLGPPPRVGLVLSDRSRRAEPEQITLPPTPAARLDVGRAHIDDHGRYQEAPMSFAAKNYASLRDLQALNVALVMPHAEGALRLGLDERHRRFLLRAMTEHPNDSDNPRYRGARYGVDAHKPLIVGARRVIEEDYLRYVGKAGRAYGFHLANAYIEDRRSHRGFFVTAAIYVNPNGVVNDNRYSYDATTAPFMADLGELLARRLLR